MKEQESSFSPEAIDALTGREPGKQLLPDEQRLIRDVYSLSREYASENERSLERIWNRLAQQGQEQPARIQQQETGTPGLFREGKAMPQKDIYQELLEERRQQGNYQEREFSTLDSHPVKRAGRSRWRALGMSAAAAVVVLTILSWAVLSAGLHHGPQSTHVAKLQTDFQTGTLLCSFSVDSQLQGALTYVAIQPTLDWSSNGQIAATYSTLKTVSAHNCTQGTAFTGTFTQFASWSPNGKQLLISKKDDSRGVEVVDAKTDNMVATFVPQQGSTSPASAQVPTTTGLSLLDSLSGGPNPVDGEIKNVVQSVWSADGTQVISAIDESHVHSSESAASVQIWNASTGELVRTALTFKANVHFITLGSGGGIKGAISPDGRYVAVEATDGSIQIWSIATGKQISTLSFTTIPSGTDVSSYLPSAISWSPDSSSLALGSVVLPNSTANSVQVWSVANGQLTATFHDTDDPTSNIGSLAWSPDGKYLAESYADIHVWDVNAHKIVATFGKVTAKQGIAALAWSPDGKMLVSSVQNALGGDPRPNTMNVWQLS